MKKLIIVLILMTASINVFAGELTRDNMTEIVTDSTNNIMWQDNYVAQPRTYQWAEGINMCEALSLGSYDNWRLPNINELRSIVSYSENNPAIYNVFRNVRANRYWSSTTVGNNHGRAWQMNFLRGKALSTAAKGGFTPDYGYVRCVRTIE